MPRHKLTQANCSQSSARGRGEAFTRESNLIKANWGILEQKRTSAGLGGSVRRQGTPLSHRTELHVKPLCRPWQSWQGLIKTCWKSKMISSAPRGEPAQRSRRGQRQQLFLWSWAREERQLLALLGAGGDPPPARRSNTSPRTCRNSPSSHLPPSRGLRSCTHLAGARSPVSRADCSSN